MVGRGVLRFKKGVCSKRVSGSVVLEAFSSRARFICTTVVQIGVARVDYTSRIRIREYLVVCFYGICRDERSCSHTWFE